MLRWLKNLISPLNTLRLFWHLLWTACAAIYYRFPSKELVCIGITGTNGKTTTTILTARILEAAGHRVAYATTEEFQIGKRRWANTAKMTTLGRGGLQRFLREAVQAGCTHAVLEVSSHALAQSRTFGIDWDAAALTNVTDDHLDFHGTFEHYRDSKMRLFWQLAQSHKTGERVAVLPADDPSFATFQQVPLEGIIGFGMQQGSLRAQDLQVADSGQRFTITGWERDFAVQTKLLGTFNVLNILAAAGIALGLGVQPKQIQKALKIVEPVAGRLELIEAGQPFRIIVDFAHSPDALEKLLRAARSITTDRVILVFGAAGDRTKNIRQKMGHAAQRLADEIIVTTDDPYDSDPVQIIADISSGIKRDLGQGLATELDRKNGITAGLELAEKDDTVVIAGKGSQQFQYFECGRKIKWDDRRVTKQICKKLWPNGKKTRKRRAKATVRHVNLRKNSQN